ncbi:molybdopterin molybdotransferase MoeA [Robertkochia solimangrovi]|uniref:molybdopterin molybdotransferase MoeA n=1 Tax=Robertkochia solimangrovi TaxID=2213046 RepID=UPI00118121C9|nr:molybdopterin molybdotransferase MoeA [Robertkochia solimangrovi]TRZ43268.1 molybdopterin molybdenumtransferase MoeA [Robertkochia solimangrovi]
MIDFDKALEEVLSTRFTPGEEKVDLLKSNGRTLSVDVVADRDFPPFNRSTKDGVAINYEAWSSGSQPLKSLGVIPAGSPAVSLDSDFGFYEIMTGAVVPSNADTVVMYEDVSIENGILQIEGQVKPGANIHRKGSDISKGAVIITAGTRIGPAEIGILASVGMDEVPVQTLPKVSVIATGNELVPVNKTPLPHQVRRSNTYSLASLLGNKGIQADQIHINDTREEITARLESEIKDKDVLILSGGVSKGKFDFIPEAMDVLGVKRLFHRVMQRPGKPFWFGIHKEYNTVVFSFPGNPVSTFVNYHLYFTPWFNNSYGLTPDIASVFIAEDFENTLPLTLFKGVRTRIDSGVIKARFVIDNGSGDLVSLKDCDGFVKLDPGKKINSGDVLIFVPTR